LNLKCIQTPPPGTVAGAHRSAPALPYLGTDRSPPARAPPASTAVGPQPATQRRPTAALPPPPRLVAAWCRSWPVPHLHRIAYKGCPITSPLFFPLSSSLAGARSSNPSSPPLFPRPRVSAGQLDCHRHAIFTLPCHCPPAPHLPSLLDRVSPPPSSPPAPGLVDTLPVHRSFAAVLGHFLRPTTVGHLR
jgi:hypothetical protein